MGPLLWVVSASQPQLTKVLPSCFLDVETGKGRHAKLATGLNVAAQRLLRVFMARSLEGRELGVFAELWVMLEVKIDPVDLFNQGQPLLKMETE